MLKKYLLLVFFLSLFFTKGVLADGFMITRPPRPEIPPAFFSVKYHHVTVDINDGIATTIIDQLFINNQARAVEGHYIFPIPKGSVISNFEIYVDGKKLSAKLLKKDRARQIYEDIVRKMKDPALLEYVGQNLLEARIFPIPAHAKRRVKISYQEVLKYDQGLYKYIYPLNTEKFSPKPLKDVSLNVKIKSRLPLKNLYSPTHKIDKEIKRYSAICGFEEKETKPDKDFILYFSVSKKDFDLSLRTYREWGKDGYFLMLLSAGELKEKCLAKDVTFVIDTSGSMNGKKLEQAQAALKFAVNTLNPHDRFNIISFGTSLSSFQEGFAKINYTNRQKALKFIDQLTARGGTNINAALLKALAKEKDQDRPSTIIFLTDGEPTVGETDEKNILRNIKRKNQKKEHRIFVFGVGEDVNTHLLDRLSEENRGLSDYILPDENLERIVSSFFDKINTPILSDLKVNFGKIKVKDLEPIVLPDLFYGSQVVILGRYQNSGTTPIYLSGKVGKIEKRFTFEGRFPKRSAEDDFIPRIFASRRIGHLLSEIRFQGEKKELVDEIITLSKEHGIMTPYTSYLILEKESDYTRYGVSKNMAQEGLKQKKDLAVKVGSGAVSRAEDIKEMREAVKVTAPSLNTIRQKGEKTFYLKDEVLVDSDYQESMGIKKIKYLSPTYLSLLRKDPEIGRYLSLGKNLIVVVKGQAYQIKEAK